MHARRLDILASGVFGVGSEVEHSSVSWRKLVRAKDRLVEQIRLDGIALTEAADSLLNRHR